MKEKTLKLSDANCETWSKTMDLRYAHKNTSITEEFGITELRLQQKSISNLGNIKWNFIEEAMSNQITPIQEAIEMIEMAQKEILSKEKYADGYFAGLDDCVNVLKSLLPKEQQVIEDAFDTGTDGTFSSFENYYNTKFKQNESK